MRLELSVSGFDASWEFSGSGGFDSWAKSRPWLNRGGMCVIRTMSEEPADIYVPCISRLLRATHGEGRQLSIRHIECASELLSPSQALLSALEIDTSLNPFEAKTSLMVHLKDRPTVVVISESTPVSSDSWYELALLVEHYSKSTPLVPVCVVVIDSRGAVQHEPAFDFTAGRATHLALASAAENEDALVWRAYLHHRACWEAAGYPYRAQVLGQILVDVETAAEDQVEKALGKFAAEQSDRVSLSQRLPQIAVAFQRLSSADRDAAINSLRELEVLWRPPGLQRLELVPWASRALLSMPNAPEVLIPRLRHNLVCAPIAVEILGYCLNAEAKIRMQLMGRQAAPADARISQSFDRFCQGEDDYVFYPKHYPLPPNRPQDIWSFATLGETIRACDRSASADIYWETLHLRNAMAHGHYVTWMHLKKALLLQRRFDI